MTATTDVDYVLVWLMTGPNAGSIAPDHAQRLFRGHMASNYGRFASGELLVAGPFIRCSSPRWRGIFVLDVRDTDAARAIVERDPGVAEGMFTPEYQVVRGPRTLRMTLALQRDALAELGATHDTPETPPPNLRTYVFATVPHADQLLALPLTRAILTLRYRDRDDAVVILDAERIEEVLPHVNPTNAPAITLEYWMSKTSLARLPRPAA